MRVRVKICGVTRPEDVKAAAEAGADAVGLVFHPGSPRHVGDGRAAWLASRIPPFVTRVGVFVDPAPERVRELVDRCGLDLVQLHGDETPELCRLFHRRVLKAVRMQGPEDGLALGRYGESVAGFLLDGYHPGGGVPFDWSWAAGLDLPRPVVLSGGLRPENVGQAIRVVRPWAVDVSSGVESAPGEKDPERIRAFVEAVRAAEAAP